MTDWTIDKKDGVATCAAWGGVFTASKPDGKWFVRYESDARQVIEDGDGIKSGGAGPAIIIDAHVHYLDGFGVASIPAGEDAINVLARAVSFNAPHAIRQHIEKEFMAALGPFLLGEGPSVFLGPDPF
jgi:hypothetical protein